MEHPCFLEGLAAEAAAGPRRESLPPDLAIAYLTRAAPVPGDDQQILYAQVL